MSGTPLSCCLPRRSCGMRCPTLRMPLQSAPRCTAGFLAFPPIAGAGVGVQPRAAGARLAAAAVWCHHAGAYHPRGRLALSGRVDSKPCCSGGGSKPCCWVLHPATAGVHRHARACTALHAPQPPSAPALLAPSLPQTMTPTRHTAAGGRRSTLGALRSWRARLPPRWRFWQLGWRW